MSNPEKKCEHGVKEHNCFRCHSNMGYTKPSPSPSCEHDDGDVWINQMFAHHKKHHKTCPFCKPTAVEPKYACEKCGKLRTKDEGGTTFTVCDDCWDKPVEVEPSVESIAEDVFEYVMNQYHKGHATRAIQYISEKLRNERNRHG